MSYQQTHTEPLSKGVATAAVILAVVTFPVSIVWLPFAWRRIVGAWNTPSAQPAYAFPPMPQYAYPTVPQQPAYEYPPMTEPYSVPVQPTPQPVVDDLDDLFDKKLDGS